MYDDRFDLDNVYAKVCSTLIIIQRVGNSGH